MSGPAITLARLTHLHPGGKGVRDLSLEVPRGSIFGFLGPNGAGKSTTIRLLLDFLRPQSGTASVLGLDPWRDGPAVRQRIGYLPGEVHLPENLTGMEFLRYAARLRGVVLPEKRLRTMVEALDANPAPKLKTLSKGNKQKIAIIHALLLTRELVILDEPTEGLDPLVQQAFHRLLAQYRDEGGTIFMSSHVLSEVERLCDQVAIIRDGRIVEVARTEALKANKARRVSLVLDAGVDRETVSSALPDVRIVAWEGTSSILEVKGDIRPFLGLLARLPVRDVAIEPASLEDSFLEYYA
jgi:ABC-2 type transport system ATP-binding protein